jgi:hypothetical protein
MHLSVMLFSLRILNYLIPVLLVPLKFLRTNMRFAAVLIFEIAKPIRNNGIMHTPRQGRSVRFQYQVQKRLEYYDSHVFGIVKL